MMAETLFDDLRAKLLALMTTAVDGLVAKARAKLEQAEKEARAALAEKLNEQQRQLGEASTRLARAEANEQAQWFGGVVTATRDLSSGARHHLVAWEDAWEGEFDWLDLANNVRVWRKEQTVGKSHKLRVKQVPATKAGAKGKEQAAQAAPAPPRTR